MRVAVIGGTGLAGHLTVAALARAGHDPVVVARSTGVDVTTGVGLDAALADVEAVIDASSTGEDPEAFFVAATQQLLAAEQRVGVGHHVVLSIVGIDDVGGNPHYAGKRRQEALVEGGPIPWTIQRATQFFEFPAVVAGWTRQGDTAVVSPLLVQPVAAADVGEVLAELAVAPPQGRAPDLAGPDRLDFAEMARRTFAARGDRTEVVASWDGGPFTQEMAGEVLVPGPGARIAPTSFETWLSTQG